MSKLQYQPPVTISPEDQTYSAQVEESQKSRAFRKFYEEPFVPIGIAATVFALGAASNSMRKGDRKNFNRFLRWRVAAQGLTVVAALAGSAYYAEDRAKRKREEELVMAQKMRENREAIMEGGKKETIVTSKASQVPDKLSSTPVLDAVKDSKRV